MTSIKNIPNKIRLTLFVVCVALQSGVAQKSGESLLWRVSGNGLANPSYLFGTFHLMGSEYIDSLSVVKAKFDSATTLIGELILDNSLAPKMMMAATMKDTVLQDILTEETYTQTSEWLKELGGMDLTMFNRFNPSMVQMLIVTLVQQKLNGKAIVPMDLHFQNLARESKQLVGLETFEEQTAVLFGSSSYVHQAKQLAEFVSKRDSSVTMLVSMNRMYRAQQLDALMEIFSESSYSNTEKDALLDNRNRNWMQKLPALFEAGSCFVAVGALHLPGQNGLVSLLRKAGYTVTPLPLN